MKIKDIKPKNSTNSYELLFGNKKISKLVSQIQSAIIRVGNDLEKIIKKHFQDNAKIIMIKTLECFTKIVIDKEYIDKGQIYFFESRLLKNYFQNHHIDLSEEYWDNQKHKLILPNPDFNFFFLTQKIIYVIELKLGNTFDTKKLQGEISSIEKYIKFMRKNINSYHYHWYLTSFLSKDVNEILKGTKGFITKDNLLTGQQLCSLLNIDFQKIILEIKSNQIDNCNYLKEVINNIKIKSYILFNFEWIFVCKNFAFVFKFF